MSCEIDFNVLVILYKGERMMNKSRTLSNQNLENFNSEKTKKKVNGYFTYLERLEWEWAKLNAQKGLTANYDFETEYRKQPYIQIGKDTFNLSAKEYKEEQLKEYISNYYWAKSILSEMEQVYLVEYFINGKYENEIVDLLGFQNTDSHEFRRLKRSAVYKFADILNLVVDKK